MTLPAPFCKHSSFSSSFPYVDAHAVSEKWFHQNLDFPSLYWKALLESGVYQQYQFPASCTGWEAATDSKAVKQDARAEFCC